MRPRSAAAAATLMASIWLAPAVRSRLDFIVDLNNLLGEEYVITGKFPGVAAGTFVMPGRNFSLGLRWKR